MEDGPSLCMLKYSFQSVAGTRRVIDAEISSLLFRPYEMSETNACFPAASILVAYLWRKSIEVFRTSRRRHTEGVQISNVVVAEVALIAHFGPIALLGEEVTQEDP